MVLPFCSRCQAFPFAGETLELSQFNVGGVDKLFQQPDIKQASCRRWSFPSHFILSINSLEYTYAYTRLFSWTVNKTRASRYPRHPFLYLAHHVFVQFQPKNVATVSPLCTPIHSPQVAQQSPKTSRLQPETNRRWARARGNCRHLHKSAASTTAPGFEATHHQSSFCRQERGEQDGVEASSEATEPQHDVGVGDETEQSAVKDRNMRRYGAWT